MAPGFIDSHVHADGCLFDDDVQLAMLSQGVTSVILGQDGLSFAPSTAATVAYAGHYFGAVNGQAPTSMTGGVDVSQFLDAFDGQVRLNTSYLVPLGSVRHQVMGELNAAPSPEQSSAMIALVRQGLADGALGVSTGLDYGPGKYAGPAELASLVETLHGSSRVYVTHMRGYQTLAWVGLAELHAILSRVDVPAHVSHLRGDPDELLQTLDRMARAGADVTYDSYPYLRAATSLAMLALPPWVGGQPVSILDQLREPAARRTLVDDWFPAQSARLGSYRLSRIGAPALRWAEGHTVADAADQSGVTVPELVYRLLLDGELDVGAVTPDPPGSDDEAIRGLLRDPRHMAGSDGIYLGSAPHPRGWGTFARYLGRHTRELEDWSWPEAIAHLATNAARRFGLRRRGTLTAGAFADLVVLDPATVGDRATYDEPRLLATGVEQVVVNGQTVLSNGTLGADCSGRALRFGL